MSALLVDAHNIAHRVWHGVSPGASVDILRRTFISTMTAIADRLNATRRIAAVERTRSFRYDVVPDYKGNRKDKPLELKDLIEDLPALSHAAGFEVWHAPNYEADDVMATFANQIAGQVLILTTDQDLYACVDQRVRVVTPHLDGFLFVDEAEVLAKYGVPPALVPLYLALAGDPSDNIKGVRGMGERKVLPLLSKFKSLKEIYDAQSTLDTTHQKLLQNTPREYVEACLQAATLVTTAPLECLYPMVSSSSTSRQDPLDQRTEQPGETPGQSKGSVPHIPIKAKDPETLFLQRFVPGISADNSVFPALYPLNEIVSMPLDLQLQLASASDCPLEVLESLACCGDVVLCAVAWHPNTSTELLKSLMQTDCPREYRSELSSGLRFAISRHPSCSPDILIELASGACEKILTSISNHPIFAEDRKVRAAVAEERECPYNLLQRLVKDPALQVRVKVLINPGIPRDIVDALFFDEHENLRAATFLRYRASIDQLQCLSRDTSSRVRSRVAESSYCPTDIMASLLQDEVTVRRSLASNRSTPEYLLLVLASDPEQEVRDVVRARTDLPTAVATRLSHYENGLA